MTERYQVTLFSQLGPRAGTLTLERRGARVTGTLELVGFQNPLEGERLPGGSLLLRHQLHTAMRDFSCITRLELQGRGLTGWTTAPECRMRWSGVRLQEDAPASVSPLSPRKRG